MRRLLLTLLLIATTPGAAGDVEVVDAWVRASPPGMEMFAGYLKLVNGGEEERCLTGISGDDFGLIEVHRTVLVEGVARMQEVGALCVAPGETVILEPGGLHLMLMRPSRPMPPGTTTVIRFSFGDRVSELELEVQRPSDRPRGAG